MEIKFDFTKKDRQKHRQWSKNENSVLREMNTEKFEKDITKKELENSKMTLGRYICKHI